MTMPQSRIETGSGPSFGRMTATVVTAIFCRIVLNSARRFAYPFAPVLSRGLGVPLTAVTSLIAVNQATGVLGLFIGPVILAIGYQLFMTWMAEVQASGSSQTAPETTSE